MRCRITAFLLPPWVFRQTQPAAASTLTMQAQVGQLAVPGQLRSGPAGWLQSQALCADRSSKSSRSALRWPITHSKASRPFFALDDIVLAIKLSR